MKALRNSHTAMPPAKRYPKKTIRLAIQLDGEGKTLGEIARQVRAHKSTVSRWLENPEAYLGPAKPSKPAPAKAAPSKPAPSKPDPAPAPSPKPPDDPVTTPPEPPAKTPPAVDEAAAPPGAPATEPTPDWGVSGFSPVVPGGDPSLVDNLDDLDASGPSSTPGTSPGAATKPADSSLAPGEAASAARAIMNPVVRTVDGRLTAKGADPITPDEREALVDAWTPIIAKWLEGPEAPIVVACVTTGVVLGPRVAQVRAANQDGGGGEEGASNSSSEPQTNAAVKDVDMAGVHAALRGQA